MIEQELYTALDGLGYPVYPVVLPQGTTYPAITYQVVYDGTEQSLNGGVYARSVRVQVDVWAKSYGEAKSLKDLVVAKIIELNGIDISAQDIYETDTLLHRQLIEFYRRR